MRIFYAGSVIRHRKCSNVQFFVSKQKVQSLDSYFLFQVLVLQLHVEAVSDLQKMLKGVSAHCIMLIIHFPEKWKQNHQFLDS